MMMKLKQRALRKSSNDIAPHVAELTALQRRFVSLSRQLSMFPLGLHLSTESGVIPSKD